SLKDKLVRYNAEDCLALKGVVDLLTRIAPGGTQVALAGSTSPGVVHTEDLQKAAVRGHRFGTKDSSLPGFNYVNRCAYFDHQRDKVFARSHPQLKAIKKRQATRRAVRINKVINLPCERCRACNSKNIFQIRTRRRLIIDLKFFRDGVKRWATKYQSWDYRCGNCDSTFTNPEFPQLKTKFGR